MKKILDLITDEVTKVFTDCGYDAKYGKVTLSNRPDLCEYQCNCKTCRGIHVFHDRIRKTGILKFKAG